jgi:integrase
MSRALAQRPASAIVAQAAGDCLPSYVTREQARAIINATTTTVHRLLLECLWQSGGRVSAVLRLRPSDLDPEAPLLHLVNMKQPRRRPATQGSGRERGPGGAAARAGQGCPHACGRVLL